MLLQSLRALCLAPGGSGSVWKYLEALVRSPGVSWRIVCGFRTELHFADVSPQAEEYAVVIPTKFKDLHGWADCVDGFIRVVKQTNKMHIVTVGAIVGLAHLVQENAASRGIDSVWLVNNHVHLDTYWTVY